ncbi:MAG: phosphotransferase [Candidatus Solibacter usitatus]|nr:phosphotransferase [Candidatus Solibacter usitatus]
MLSAQAAGFDSQDVFDELRLDPYYRFTASRHPKLAHYFHAAIARCGEQRCALVHGDWSPKNMIVDGPRLTAIDFEVIHFGDPSFDSAFLLNHLLLKSFHQPQHAPRLLEAARTYWDGIRPVMDLNEGTLLHLPLLLLARVDGKSPAEYIREEAVKKRVREFALELLHSSGARVEDALAGRSWSGLN